MSRARPRSMSQPCVLPALQLQPALPVSLQRQAGGQLLPKESPQNLRALLQPPALSAQLVRLPPPEQPACSRLPLGLAPPCRPRPPRPTPSRLSNHLGVYVGTYTK